LTHCHSHPQLNPPRFSLYLSFYLPLTPTIEPPPLLSVSLFLSSTHTHNLTPPASLCISLSISKSTIVYTNLLCSCSCIWTHSTRDMSHACFGGSTARLAEHEHWLTCSLFPRTFLVCFCLVSLQTCMLLSTQINTHTCARVLAYSSRRSCKIGKT
jgi:hypothetical protein